MVLGSQSSRPWHRGPASWKKSPPQTHCLPTHLPGLESHGYQGLAELWGSSPGPAIPPWLMATSSHTRAGRSSRQTQGEAPTRDRIDGALKAQRPLFIKAHVLSDLEGSEVAGLEVF